MSNNSQSKTYKEAGVDITSGYKAVELMKQFVNNTLSSDAIIDNNGFGMYKIPSGYKNPYLVAGADGVGTKLKIAFALQKYDTVGIDVVAMCVNDILRVGAKPLYFLDYIACGILEPKVAADLVKGVAKGCVLAGASLIGGETAEMPSFYQPGEYDIAGFTTGIVEYDKIVNGNNMAENDVCIAIASSGVHSNGFSLVRKVFNIDNMSKTDLLTPVKELNNKSLGEVLLTPTKIYVKSVLAVLEKVQLCGIAHITGGGFYEKVPRSIKLGYKAQINLKAIKVLPIFKHIQLTGNIPTHDMFNTFNMGVGMVLTCKPNDVDIVINTLKQHNEDAYVIGKIVKSNDNSRVELI